MAQDIERLRSECDRLNATVAYKQHLVAVSSKDAGVEFWASRIAIIYYTSYYF